MNKITEYADNFRASDRITAGANSLQRWYKRKHNALVKKHVELFSDQVKETDPAKRALLTEETERAKNEIDELNGQMSQCRLANLDSEYHEYTSVGERRIQVTPRQEPVQIPAVKKERVLSGRKKINGIAAVYNQWTDIGGYWRECIAKGAFTKVLTKCDCRLLFNHQPDHVLGRTSSKSCRLYDTNTGLLFWGDLIRDDPLSEAIFSRIHRGDISGCSFAFTVEDDDWILKGNQMPERTILEIEELFDVGPVTYPAYPQTSVQVVVEREETIEEMMDRLDREENEEDDRKYRFNQLERKIKHSNSIARFNEMQKDLDSYFSSPAYRFAKLKERINAG